MDEVMMAVTAGVVAHPGGMSNSQAVNNSLFGVPPLLFVSVLGTVIAAVVPRWAEATERRRTRYAEAVKGLVSWVEFPYRVARRVGNDPRTLEELARLGHSLQENLAFHEAWVSAESPRMGKLYGDVVGALKAEVGKAIKDAWLRPAASFPDGMNVGDLGIDQSQLKELIDGFSSRTRSRFGWRRLLGPLNRYR